MHIGSNSVGRLLRWSDAYGKQAKTQLAGPVGGTGIQKNGSGDESQADLVINRGADLQVLFFGNQLVVAGLAAATLQHRTAADVGAVAILNRGDLIVDFLAFGLRPDFLGGGQTEGKNESCAGGPPGTAEEIEGAGLGTPAAGAGFGSDASNKERKKSASELSGANGFGGAGTALRGVARPVGACQAALVITESPSRLGSVRKGTGESAGWKLIGESVLGAGGVAP